MDPPGSDFKDFEGSHQVEKILDAKGAPVVNDEEEARETLRKYDDIQWIGDGWYERYLDGV
jgi:hypothetical protein